MMLWWYDAMMQKKYDAMMQKRYDALMLWYYDAKKNDAMMLYWPQTG